MIVVREEERRRTARLLERWLAGRLLLLQEQTAAYAAAARMGAALDAQALLILAEAAARARSELEELTVDLAALELDALGLRAALQNLSGRMQRRYGFACALDLPPAGRAPWRQVSDDPRMAVCLYRIAQEALDNIGRHAHAGQAALSLRVEAHQLHLVVSDDGAGFEPPRPLDALRSGGRCGLAEMAERAAGCGGRLEVHSLSGVGSQVRAALPLNLPLETPVEKMPLVEELTPRELDVLAGAVEGLTNRQIAVRLGISDRTVQHHLSNVLGKLGASSRTEAAVLAVQRGLINPR